MVVIVMMVIVVLVGSLIGRWENYIGGGEGGWGVVLMEGRSRRCVRFLVVILMGRCENYGGEGCCVVLMVLFVVVETLVVMVVQGCVRFLFYECV